MNLPLSTSLEDPFTTAELAKRLSIAARDPIPFSERGVFRLIVTERIDLPPARSNHTIGRTSRLADRWLRHLPESISSILRGAGSDSFYSILLTRLYSNSHSPSLPKPRFHGASNEYLTLLERAHDSGMLHWSSVAQEDDEYRVLADKVEMTLFAVTKDMYCDRLISWPRVQNELLPPPFVSLPDPSLLGGIRCDSNGASAIFLDIQNMYHNIPLPHQLARLFPLRPVSLHQLPPPFQTKLAQYLQLSLDFPHLLRPCLGNLPKGFTWAVYIGHTIVLDCIRQAFRIFRTSTPAKPHPLTELYMTREQAPFYVSQHHPLVMHIIEDINLFLSRGRTGQFYYPTASCGSVYAAPACR